MKNKLVLMALASVLVAPLAANAEHNPYMRLDLGGAFPEKLKNEGYYNNKRPKDSMLYSVGAGFTIRNNVKADLTLSRVHNFKFSEDVYDAVADATAPVKQDILSTMMMVNGHYDLGHYNRFIPYLSASVGIAVNKGKDYVDKSSTDTYIKGAEKANFAWGIGAGVSVPMNKFDIDLGYKFYNLGKVTTSETMVSGAAKDAYPAADSWLKAHTLTVGVRFPL
jgi:opacity protein-like surface antigen